MSEHEGRYSQEIYISPDATDASTFDDLAKGLASGTLSRGKALRLLGGALVGAALTSLPGVAWAQGGGNSACVKCCKKAFEPGEKITVRGRERSARGYCVSQSAKNRECYVPCDDNGNGDCPDGEELCQGECVSKCPEGQTLDPIWCECVEACPPGSLPPILNEITCRQAVEGTCQATCVTNVCTGESTCVCCPIDGPCPCLPMPDTSTGCFIASAQCGSGPPDQVCGSTDLSSARIYHRCPGPHNVGCDQNPICLEPL